MADRLNDPEQRAFVLSFPRRATYSEIAAACRGKLGARRAWSVSEIAAVWSERNGSRRRRSFDDRPDVIDYIDDRADRWPIDAIVAGLAKELKMLVPRSTVYDYVVRFRAAVAARMAKR